MARTKAISLIQQGSTKADLKEISGLVIENIQKATLSNGLKSQAYTGNPAAGSVEFKRFKNSASNPYGTARRDGKGDALTVPPITVNLDQHREIVEEAAKFDLDTFGVANIMARRADNHVDTVVAELDTAFFEEAVIAGVSFEPTGLSNIEDQVEAMIQALETVKNDYVRGVPRSMMNLVCSPSFYGKIRNYLDKTANNANVDTTAEEFALFHGVKTYSSVYLPEKIDAVLMIDGAIALPVVIYPYKDPEKIPLSNDYAVAMFYDYGCKALTPDLIFFYGLGTLTVTSVAGSSTGKTKISVAEPVLPGRKLVYKIDPSTALNVNYNEVLNVGTGASDWKELPAGGEIGATGGHTITVVEIDVNDSKAKKAGSTTVVSA